MCIIEEPDWAEWRTWGACSTSCEPEVKQETEIAFIIFNGTDQNNRLQII